MICGSGIQIRFSSRSAPVSRNGPSASSGPASARSPIRRPDSLSFQRMSTSRAMSAVVGNTGIVPAGRTEPTRSPPVEITDPYPMLAGDHRQARLWNTLASSHGRVIWIRRNLQVRRKSVIPKRVRSAQSASVRSVARSPQQQHLDSRPAPPERRCHSKSYCSKPNVDHPNSSNQRSYGGIVLVY
jgi:hypothetical protein